MTEERVAFEQLHEILAKVAKSAECEQHQSCRVLYDATECCIGHAKLINDVAEASQPYDIEVEYCDGSLCWIEVKGTERSLVQLSAAQIEYARDYCENYILVVVDRAESKVLRVWADPYQCWIDGTLRADWLVRVK